MILLLADETIPAGTFNAPDMILGRTWPATVEEVEGNKIVEVSRVPASCIHTLIAWFGARPVGEDWTSEGLNDIGGHEPVKVKGVKLKAKRKPTEVPEE